MLNDKEVKKIKVQLEFVGNVLFVFEDFFIIFQNSCLQVYFLYDKMLEFLCKFMGRFLKKDVYEKNFGSDLVSIDCSVNSQLFDVDIVIGEVIKKVLVQINLDCRKFVYFGICIFYSIFVIYLQFYFFFQNIFLKVLGCFNFFKREK